MRTKEDNGVLRVLWPQVPLFLCHFAGLDPYSSQSSTGLSLQGSAAKSITAKGPLLIER